MIYQRNTGEKRKEGGLPDGLTTYRMSRQGASGMDGTQTRLTFARKVGKSIHTGSIAQVAEQVSQQTDTCHPKRGGQSFDERGSIITNSYNQWVNTSKYMRIIINQTNHD